MAYDERLAERIRDLLAAEADLSEAKMFGGLAFLIAGNMAVVASGQGGIMVRVDPADQDRLVAQTKADPMIMRGKPTKGWLRVSSEHLARRSQLQAWVDRGVGWARALPPK